MSGTATTDSGYYTSGVDDADSADGVKNANDVDDEDGWNRLYATDGADGKISADRADGVNSVNGTNGVNGTDGADGVDAVGNELGVQDKKESDTFDCADGEGEGEKDCLDSAYIETSRTVGMQKAMSTAWYTGKLTAMWNVWTKVS